MQKVQKISYRFFAVALLLVICMAFLASIVGDGHKLPYMALVVTALLLIIWLTSNERLKETYLLAIFLCFLIAQFGFQCWRALAQYYIPPRGDLEAIYTGVNELMEEGKLTLSNTYFLQHPHQNFVLFELFIYRRLIGLFGILQAPAIYQAYGILSVLSINAGLVLFMLTVKAWRGKRIALVCGIVGVIFLSPLRFWVTEAYTHILVLPYLFLSMWLFSMATHCSHRIKKYLCYFGSAVSIGLASMMAGSTSIVLIALLIAAFLKFSLKEFLLTFSVMLIGFFSIQMLFSLVWQNSKYIDMSTSNENVFPYTHWIAMGLNSKGDFGPGTFSEDDYQETVNTVGKQEKEAMLANKIQQRLADKGLGGLAIHQWSKLKTAVYNLAYSGEIIVINGVSVWKWANIGLIPALLLLMAFSIILKWKKSQVDFDFIALLVVVGVLLFLQIWETSTHYLFSYYLFLVPPAISGGLEILKKAKSTMKAVKQN